MMGRISGSGQSRRGNALILVAALLVLMVLLATVFLTRARGIRTSAKAARQVAERDRLVESAAKAVASEIAGSLFTRPIDYDPDDPLLGDQRGLPVEEERRLPPAPGATRHDVDEHFAWNYAPSETVAWTNPPDWLTYPLQPGRLREMVQDLGYQFDSGQWPVWSWPSVIGPDGAEYSLFAGGQWTGAATSPANIILSPQENPMGGPGISDTRWLRDLEPQRSGSRPPLGQSNLFVDTTLQTSLTQRHADVMTHWRHLSFPATPWNGWKLVTDIADVTGARSYRDPDGAPGNDVWVDGQRYYGGLLDRLDLPVEQWPAIMPTYLAGGFGGPQDFRLTGFVQSDPNVPPNLQPIDSDPGGTIMGRGSILYPDTDRVDVVDFTNSMSPETLKIDFWDRWQNWFTPLGYREALRQAEQGSGLLLPPNLYDLSDIDGDGIHHEDGEAADDEFQLGTLRNTVSRVLADSDGDGNTDSFWFLSPEVGADGTRQLVAISVTDNSGRLNVNSATRGFGSDSVEGSGTRWDFEGTRGLTPADLALVGQNYAPYGPNDDVIAPIGQPTWNIGFFDAEHHQDALQRGLQDNSGWPNVHPTWANANQQLAPWYGELERFGWHSERWQEPSNWTSNLLGALGIRDHLAFPDGSLGSNGPADVNDRENRVFYYQAGASQQGSPQGVFTPFNFSDEFELRAYEGQNMPWLYSRLERATGGMNTDWSNADNALRSYVQRTESAEDSEQLTLRQLGADLRHRLTTISGARNDLLAPHLRADQRMSIPPLWWLSDQIPNAQEAANIASDDPDVIDDLIASLVDQFREKIDLREAPTLPQRTGTSSAATLRRFNLHDRLIRQSTDPNFYWRRRPGRLGFAVMLGLTGGAPADRDRRNSLGVLQRLGGRTSLYGRGDRAWEHTRRTAAALVANMRRHTEPGLAEGPYPSGFDGLPIAQGPFSTAPGIRPSGATSLPFAPVGYLPDTNTALLMDSDTDDSGQGDGLADMFQWGDGGQSSLVAVRQATQDLSALPPEDPSTLAPVRVDLDGDGELDAGVSGNYLEYHTAAEVVKDSWDPRISVLPAEPQPVIGEVFVAHVARPWRIPGDPTNDVNTVGYTDSNDWTMLTAYTSKDDTEFKNTETAALPVDDYMPPVRPRTVMAVQLLNPFDEPIVLVEGGLPKYRLRMVTSDRFDPESPALAQFDLLPSAAVSAEGPVGRQYVLRPGSSLSSPNPQLNNTWVLPPSNGDKPYALTIVMNAVDGMPGFDTNFNPPAPFTGEQAWQPSEDVGQSGYRTLEAERWLDFLDVHHAASTNPGPADQAFGDEVAFRADPDLDGQDSDLTLQMAQGDLVWHLMPVGGWPVGIPGDKPSQDQKDLPDTPANWWAAHGLSDGTFQYDALSPDSNSLEGDYDSDTENWHEPGAQQLTIVNRLKIQESVDQNVARPPTLPERGSAVELVRLHYPDQWTAANGGGGSAGEPGGDGIPDDTNLDGRLTAQDAVPVTVDRTVGLDGYDELLMVLTDQMEKERLPRPGNLPNPTVIIAGQGGGGMPKQPLIGSGNSAFKASPATAGNGQKHSPYYPGMLWSIDADFANPDSPTGEELSQRPDRFEGDVKTSLLRHGRSHHIVHPHFARVVQWARWARPWAVDDHVVENNDWQADAGFANLVFSDQSLDYLLADASAADSTARAGIVRPDRAGPRFALGPGQVTKSSTRDGLLRYQLQGNIDNAEAALTQFAPFTDTGGQDLEAGRLLHQAVKAFSVGGVQAGGTAGSYSVTRRDMPMLDSNMALANPVRTLDRMMDQYNAASWGAGGIPEPVRDLTNLGTVLDQDDAERIARTRMRRYAEQSFLYPDQFSVDEAGRNWALWQVANDWTPPDADISGNTTPRLIWALPLDAPQLDLNLPHNPIAAPNTWGASVPFLPPDLPGSDWADWGLVVHDGSNQSGTNADDLEEIGTTYHDSLGWLHHRIFDARWDPDGLGRTDANGDSTAGAGDPYEAGDNAYPYPWMTRMTREDWGLNTDRDQAPLQDCVAFRARKPHALGMSAVYEGLGVWANGNQKVVKGDVGWDFNDATGDNYDYRWSFADKGVYGLREIDGDIFMPHGFQMPSQRPRNFERAGEVLDVFAAGTQLWTDIQGGVGNFPWPTMVDWPPQPASRHTPNYLRAPATLRTLPEWLGEDIAAGRRPGRLDPFFVDVDGDAGGTAIVGGPWSTQTFNANATDPFAPGVPDWYVTSDDPAHFTPDLPATHQLVDMFVCDGPGTWDLGADTDQDGLVDQFNGPDGVVDANLSLQSSSFEQVTGQNASLGNAGRFLGRSTTGLVNINTAPVEVLRALPQMYRLMHGGADWDSGGGNGGILDQSSQLPGNTDRPMSRHPRSGIPEAIVQYRDALGGTSGAGQSNVERTPGTSAGPVYADRGLGHKTVGVGSSLISDRDIDGVYEQNYQQEDVRANDAVQWSRGHRGFASIGELLNLQRPAIYDFAITVDENGDEIDRREWPGTALAADAWRMDWAARNPFGFQAEQNDGVIDPLNPPANSPFRDAVRGVYYENIGAPLITDTGRLWDYRGFGDDGGPYERELSRSDLLYSPTLGNQPFEDPLSPIVSERMPTTDPRFPEVSLTMDRTAGDAEEANLLFSGISNMITTRSDIFTVHLKVRTIRRNPDTGIWDGTDRDSIVDDSRYVMIVDRSEVDRPSDAAKILMLEKVDD